MSSSRSSSPVKSKPEKKPKKAAAEKKPKNAAAEKKPKKKASVEKKPAKKQSSKPADSEAKPKKAPVKQLKWVQISEGIGKEPKRATAGSAGYDLFSAEHTSFEPGELRLISTGIAVAIPKGFYGSIRSRSGLAKRGLEATTSGVIDSDYRGEVLVMLRNHSDTTISVALGDAVAQLLIEQLAPVRIVRAKTLSKTKRGAGGFGSTDKKEKNKGSAASASSESEEDAAEKKEKKKKAKRDASPVREEKE
jgi:dUTP pyrophosphatase